MCAIFAIVHSVGRRVDCDLLHRANDRLRHRGPDDEGYVLIDRRGGQLASYAGDDSPARIREEIEPLPRGFAPERFDAAMAHRRFAIVDEKRGHQPLIGSAGRACVAFHGEIYNYRELREELVRRGHAFVSDSDTEVVLQAYEVWGSDCFRRFNGAWAVVLWDPRTKQLIVSRDRLGEAPLYWTRWQDTLCVASEIKPLLLVRPASVRQASIRPFLDETRRDLDDSTFFEGVHCFPPASWGRLDERFPSSIERYWNLPRRRLDPREMPIDDAVARVRDVLRDSVRLRLPRTTPWCAEMSGGLDSSIVVALAAELSADPVTTYTLRYPGHQIEDESGYARAVADYHDTDHRVFETDVQGFWEDMHDFTARLEEPVHSPNVYTRHLMHRQMRQDGFRVVCGGTGGDELFGGYGGHFLPAQLENLASRRWRDFIENELGWRRDRPRKRRLREVSAHLWALACIAARSDRRSYLLSEIQRCDLLNFGIPRDLGSNGIPYWVRTDDRARMGVPIEGRSPFLDHRVVELAFTMPTSYLIRHGWHKWILRVAFRDRLPREVAWRTSKLGLQFPFVKCLEIPAEIRGLFRGADQRQGDFSCLRPLLEDGLERASFEQNDWDTNTFLWRRMSFLLWQDRFIARS
jgi:asparagine synthase (glutamine-hydrolysing)